MAIKSKLAAFCVACPFIFAWGATSANELIATIDNAKNNTTKVALDFVSEGDATAFEFEVTIPKGAKVDTTKCTSELPSTHSGACAFNEKNGRVVVMVYSNSLTPLANGVSPIGSLIISGKSSKNISVQNILVSDKNSSSLQARTSAFSANAK